MEYSLHISSNIKRQLPQPVIKHSTLKVPRNTKRKHEAFFERRDSAPWLDLEKTELCLKGLLKNKCLMFTFHTCPKTKYTKRLLFSPWKLEV